MMDKIRNAVYRFMVGRYGNDQLNAFLMCLALVLAILNALFFKNAIVTFLVWVLLGIEMFRCYSKKIYTRRVENDKFLRMMAPVTKRLNLMKKQAEDKEHKYFVCPNCKQNVRVPRGRGKITITCPKCRTKFDRRS